MGDTARLDSGPDQKGTADVGIAQTGSSRPSKGRYAHRARARRGRHGHGLSRRGPKHDRKVALKVLKPELAAVVGAERFLAEIKTTANLQHPHILPLFDSGEADGFLYYVMPYVEGETLRDQARPREAASGGRGGEDREPTWPMPWTTPTNRA